MALPTTKSVTRRKSLGKIVGQHSGRTMADTVSLRVDGIKSDLNLPWSEIVVTKEEAVQKQLIPARRFFARLGYRKDYFSSQRSRFLEYGFPEPKAMVLHEDRRGYERRTPVYSYDELKEWYEEARRRRWIYRPHAKRSTS